MRRTWLAIAILSLAIGPWLALPVRLSAAGPESLFGPASLVSWHGQVVGPGGGTFAAPPISRATGCSCREVVVEASNVVRGADVRTGDAKVVNRTVTYIAPTFDGDDEVEVDQEATARSGDAVAGQILGIDAGRGCARVRVAATNIVEDSDVRTGDAIAKNKSVVLIDPRIPLKDGDIEIEVDQEAQATSGDAIAGQIIGVRGGGGPCGGVIVDAVNRLRNVDVRSGDAVVSNMSLITHCIDIGCVDDIALMLATVDSVQVCAYDSCTSVPVEEFVEMLENPPPAPEPSDDDDDDADENDDERDEMDRVKEANREELAARKAAAIEDFHNRHPGRASDTAVEASPTPSPEGD